MTSALLPTYVRAPLAFERGEGAWLVTEAGERYLDFGAGIAVNALGHAHPHLVGALTEQANRIWHTSNLFQIPGGERLGQRLVEATFADVVFFCNSGAEANEAAIKIARKYHAAGGHPERYRIVTFAGAFHGRTLATLAAGGQQKYIEGFGPKVEGFDQVAGRRFRRTGGRDRARDGRPDDRADPGRGRRARDSPRASCAGCARSATRTACC